MPRGNWGAILIAAAGVIQAGQSAVAAETCSGPPACCPAELSEHPPHKVTVSIGAVLVGLNDANERAGTWDADLYLYESWPVTAGFSPQTEVVNEVSRETGGNDFDLTTLDGDQCSRTRRLRLKLHTRYNLRRFPFDHQRLELELSDSEFDSTKVAYAASPSISGVDDRARDELSAWSIEDDLSFKRETRGFKWEPQSPSYDYATFSIHARRHVSFHLARFFLPLLLLVAIAWGQFWIDPDDLNSQITLGISCLLAVIAQQFAESSNLPDVAYLTFADRMYVLSYVAIAASIFESFYTNQLVRRKKRELAIKIDRISRRLYPLLVILAVVAAAEVSFALPST